MEPRHTLPSQHRVNQTCDLQINGASHKTALSLHWSMNEKQKPPLQLLLPESKRYLPCVSMLGICAVLHPPELTMNKKRRISTINAQQKKERKRNDEK